MLDQIFNAVQTLSSLAVNAWEFAVGIFEDLAYMIRLCGAFISKIPSFLGFLPASVVAIVVAGLSIILILRVGGRSE